MDIMCEEALLKTLIRREGRKPKKNNGEFLMKQVRHHGKLEVRKKNDLQE